MKWALTFLVMVAQPLAWADEDVPSRFLNRDSVVNTRHNMTQRQDSGGDAVGLAMGPYRNNYEEVCIYCHTPHFANSSGGSPLWNRTMPNTFYNNYNSMTLEGNIVSPGPNSLTCLSCHDGVTAIDSVINMPGTGGVNKDQETLTNDAFLDTWNNAVGPDAEQHQALAGQDGERGCLSCHSPNAGSLGAGATDFRAFVLGSDLSNDHPVGVPFRNPEVYPDVDYRTASRIRRNLLFFDTDGDGYPDADELRLYDSGRGFMVECASCHDPHGVPAQGGGALFNKTFMRVTNDGSSLCLTCHIK